MNRPAPPSHGDPDVVGNARLIGMAALVLLVLLAVEGVTILRIHRLLPWHVLVGFALIPPVLLKLASTGYRFTRYYTGNRRYRAAGPPRPLPRLIAPLVVLTTMVLFATGVELWLFGRHFGAAWLRVHQLSFLVWFGAMTIHVVTYLARAPSLALADFGHERAVRGAATRRSLVAGALLLGLVLAAAA